MLVYFIEHYFTCIITIHEYRHHTTWVKEYCLSVKRVLSMLYTYMYTCTRENTFWRVFILAKDGNVVLLIKFMLTTHFKPIVGFFIFTIHVFKHTCTCTCKKFPLNVLYTFLSNKVKSTV